MSVELGGNCPKRKYQVRSVNDKLVDHKKILDAGIAELGLWWQNVKLTQLEHFLLKSDRIFRYLLLARFPHGIRNKIYRGKTEFGFGE